MGRSLSPLSLCNQRRRRLPPSDPDGDYHLSSRVLREKHAPRPCFSCGRPLDISAPYSTTTLPVIFGWTEQKYAYVPALVNV